MLQWIIILCISHSVELSLTVIEFLEVEYLGKPVAPVFPRNTNSDFFVGWGVGDDMLEGNLLYTHLAGHFRKFSLASPLLCTLKVHKVHWKSEVFMFICKS